VSIATAYQLDYLLSTDGRNMPFPSSEAPKWALQRTQLHLERATKDFPGSKVRGACSWLKRFIVLRLVEVGTVRIRLHTDTPILTSHFIFRTYVYYTSLLGSIMYSLCDRNTRARIQRYINVSAWITHSNTNCGRNNVPFKVRRVVAWSGWLNFHVHSPKLQKSCFTVRGRSICIYTAALSTKDREYP